jgi:hypothetical protein
VSQTRQILGRWGEQLAGKFLVEHGYTITDSNVRTPYGEIDLIARQTSQRAAAMERSVTVFDVKTQHRHLVPERGGHPPQAGSPRFRPSTTCNSILSGETGDRCDRHRAQPEHPLIHHFENAVH